MCAIFQETDLAVKEDTDLMVTESGLRSARSMEKRIREGFGVFRQKIFTSVVRCDPSMGNKEIQIKMPDVVVVVLLPCLSCFK